MKSILKLAIAVALIALGTRLSAQTWTTVTTDVSGDGSDATLLDGTMFEYNYDKDSDSIFFRVTVSGFTASSQAALGVNVMVNIPGGVGTFNFWGADNMNPYHKLLTTWVTGAPPASYSGTIGVSDAAGVGAMNYTSLSSNNIDVNVDVAANQIVLGMKRTDLVTDAEMGGDQITLTAAAAVGSNQFWNDDVITGTGTMIIDKTTVPTGIEENTILFGLTLFPNPAVDNIAVQYELKESSTVSIRVIDAMGKEVMNQPLGNRSIGSQKANVNLQALAEGVYFIQVVANDNYSAMHRFVK